MEVLGVGPMELLLILVLAFIVFGPDRLPEIARGLGKALREFRKMSQGMMETVSELKEELDVSSLTEIQQELQDASREITSGLQSVAQSVGGAAAEAQEAVQPLVEAVGGATGGVALGQVPLATIEVPREPAAELPVAATVPTPEVVAPLEPAGPIPAEIPVEAPAQPVEVAAEPAGPLPAEAGEAPAEPAMVKEIAAPAALAISTDPARPGVHRHAVAASSGYEKKWHPVARRHRTGEHPWLHGEMAPGQALLPEPPSPDIPGVGPAKESTIPQGFVPSTPAEHGVVMMEGDEPPVAAPTEAKLPEGQV